MRARNIKPGFFTNDQLSELPFEARLLFIGLWCMADRDGRLEDRPKAIKMRIFPADALDVEPLLAGLERQRLIQRYEREGLRCIAIPAFAEHQRPHPNETSSGLPAYDVAPAPSSNGASTSNQGVKRSALNPSSLNVDVLNPEKDPTAAARPAELPEFAEFRASYPERNGNQPWRRALTAANARLAEGHTWPELLGGADRYARWCKATGKLGTEHVMQAATFCGPDKPFLKPWTLPATKADTRMASNFDAAAEAERRLFGGA